MPYVVSNIWWILGGAFFPSTLNIQKVARLGDMTCMRGALPASRPSHPGSWQVLLPISFKFKIRTALPLSSRVASQGSGPNTSPFVPLLWSISPYVTKCQNIRAWRLLKNNACEVREACVPSGLGEEINPISSGNLGSSCFSWALPGRGDYFHLLSFVKGKMFAHSK